MRAGFHDNELSLRETFQLIRREQSALRHLQTLAVAVLSLTDGAGKDSPVAEGFGQRLRCLTVRRKAAKDGILTVIGYDLRALFSVILFELRETLDDRHERQLTASACRKQRQNIKGRHRTKFIAVKYHALFQLSFVRVRNGEQLSRQVLDHEARHEVFRRIFLRDDQEDRTLLGCKKLRIDWTVIAEHLLLLGIDE